MMAGSSAPQLFLLEGEGTRLRDLTHKIAGHDVPKQFCRIVGEATLLEQTLQRAALVVPPESISPGINASLSGPSQVGQ